MISRNIKRITTLCLIGIFALSSCTSKRMGVADTVDQSLIGIDSTQVKTTTWGLDATISDWYGNKDDTAYLPDIPGLYVASRWSYCKNDSCNTGYYVMGLQCPDNKYVKQWASRLILTELGEGYDKKVKTLEINSDNGYSDKQIVDYYLDSWKKEYDDYNNNFRKCVHDKMPTEQIGLFIANVWKYKQFYTMCVHTWDDMNSCGNHVADSYYTVSSTNGDVLTLNDIIRRDDIPKLEKLLKRKLAWEKSKRVEPVALRYTSSHLNLKSGIALIEEGLLVYYIPYALGFGGEGQYNIIFPYEQLTQNGINIKL